MIEISVIVPTYNCKEKLAALLNSLRAQTFDAERFEIIIVDDGSCDGTAEMAWGFEKGKPQLTYTRIENSGPGIARNIGASMAAGSILAFIDGDCIASPNWVEQIYRLFEVTPELQVAHGPVNSSVPNLPPFVHSFQIKDELFPTANFAIRKEYFQKLDGFDPVLSYWAEDWDFIARVRKDGGKIAYCEGMAVTHPPKYRGYSFRKTLTPGRFWKVIRYVIKKHPDLPFRRHYQALILRVCLKVLFILLVIVSPMGVGILWKFGIIFSAFGGYALYRTFQIRVVIAASGLPISIHGWDCVKFMLLHWLSDFYNFGVFLFTSIIDKKNFGGSIYTPIGPASKF